MVLMLDLIDQVLIGQEINDKRRKIIPALSAHSSSHQITRRTFGLVYEGKENNDVKFIIAQAEHFSYSEYRKSLFLDYGEKMEVNCAW